MNENDSNINLELIIDACDTIDLKYFNCSLDELAISVMGIGTGWRGCLKKGNKIKVTNSNFKGFRCPVDIRDILIENNTTSRYAYFKSRNWMLPTNYLELDIRINCNFFSYTGTYQNAFLNIYSKPETDTIRYKSHYFITNNTFEFHKNVDGILEQGFNIGQDNNAEYYFENNIISGRTVPVYILNNREDGTFNVNNNTFLNNSSNSIVVFSPTNRLKIFNNIFNKVDLELKSSEKFHNINYNQYASNSNFTNLQGAALPIAKNTQGSNIDTYLNIIEDPQFSRAPLLASTSPMIGAGVNGKNIGFDPKGTCLEDYFDNWNGGPNPNLGDTLSISGKIKVSGANVISATVKAVNVLTHREFVANADLSGNFVIDSLPLGKYYIETTPLADLANSYLITYYPRRSTLQQADTINIQGKIIDMQIYLVSKTTVGLYDEELVSKIYPNPFKDQLIVENKSNEQITVSDVSGRVIFAGQQMSEPINTQAWQSGMYFVKINNQVLKFVKE